MDNEGLTVWMVQYRAKQGTGLIPFTWSEWSSHQSREKAIVGYERGLAERTDSHEFRLVKFMGIVYTPVSNDVSSLTEEDYRELETLFAYLRDFSVVKRVGEFYERYGNTAPAELLQQQCKKLESILQKNRSTKK